MSEVFPKVMIAFLIGAGAMALGGIAELFPGVKAEKAALEDIAKPLTAEEAEEGALPGAEEDGEEQRRARATSGAGRGSSAAGGEAEGPATREELFRRAGARGWGPGRFRSALAEAVDEGRVSRQGRNRYGPGKK